MSEMYLVPIGRCFETLKAELAPIFEGLPEGLAEENMQARLRGIILMSVSNKLGGMVLATGNKSEVSVGYCTLYGDTCGGLAPISDLYKTEVYQLSYWINERRCCHGSRDHESSAGDMGRLAWSVEFLVIDSCYWV